MIENELPRFQSFLMAGFECTAALAENHRRLDLLADTKHDVLVEQDYALIAQIGLTTVREGFAWHLIDKGTGKYFFDRYIPMLEAGQKLGIQQIWDLNHFDYPPDLDPFSTEFVDRFAAYAVAVVQLIRTYQSGTIYVVPINEISFFAWIGADRGVWAPYRTGSQNGFLLKQQLVRAAIKAMDEVWKVDDSVRFIQVDPFMRRIAVPPASRSARKHVQEFNTIVRFEAWDMLSGRRYPELGGNPKYLDIIGVNYYIHNQEWVFSAPGPGKALRHQLVDWESQDRVSFASMLQELYDRYQRPLLISETGSFGEHRTQWWQRLLAEIDQAIAMKLPVSGVCAYPILDRPESSGFLLPNSGWWDFKMDDRDCCRIPHDQTLDLITDYLRHRN